ncbi:MAG: DUF2877 domain-containing protein, partial [Candidatus Aureabacteria bacterium]|nr:DUF2877 domain-containing protein [Candidatus Auribacterota bacterium]
RNYPPPYPFSRDRGHRPLGRMDSELKLRMDALVSCLTNREESEFENAFLSLLGLGDGLTPAADDFLTGALAAAWWLKEARSSEFLREESAKLIARHADKTTPISRHFLSAAAQGVFCEFVYRLLEAFSGGDEKGIATWANWIRGWGATSGSWFLHGFAATASALIKAIH